jgi:hypothetical protein
MNTTLPDIMQVEPTFVLRKVKVSDSLAVQSVQVSTGPPALIKDCHKQPEEPTQPILSV